MQDQVTANSEDEKSNEVKTPQQYSFQIAVVLSAIIIGFSVLIWIGVLHIPASPYEAQNSSINIGFNIADFGTYVSGIFTSLSFIWLVVNALQQREDLKLQREEMQENNEHQQKQAEQLEASARISLENSKIQKEIYAIEKFHPHLQTIYLSLRLKSIAVRVQPTAEASEAAIRMICSEFRMQQEAITAINIFLIQNAVPTSSQEPNNADPYNIISTINHFMDILSSNLHKIKKINSQQPKSFQLIDAHDYLNDLRNLFTELERLLSWLQPTHASSLRSLCKLNQAKECFVIIDDNFLI